MKPIGKSRTQAWILGEAANCFECWHVILVINNWIVAKALQARVLMFCMNAKRGNTISRWMIRFFLNGEYIDPQQVLPPEALKKIQQDAKRVFLKLRRPKDILKITYQGLEIGQQIYDDVLKYRHKTIDRIFPEVQSSIAKAFLIRSAAQEIVKKYNIVAGVITHTTCAFEGVLIRSLLTEGKPVYQFFGGLGAIFKLDGWRSKKRVDVPPHTRPPQKILQPRFAQFSFLLKKARQYFTERFQGKGGDIDSAGAFADGKKCIEKDFLMHLPAALKALPKVFVFVHCMPDDPHVTCGRKYQDYYDWFQATLEAARSCPHALWVFKDHPSKKIYKFLPDLEKEIRQTGRENILYLDSEKYSNRGLEKLMDCVLTHSGTAALEFSALGVPSYAADTSAFSGLGLVREFRTREQYLNFIRFFHRRKILPPPFPDRAKVAFYLCAQLINQKLSQGIFYPKGNLVIKTATKKWMLCELGGFLRQPGKLVEACRKITGMSRLIRKHCSSGQTELILELQDQYRVYGVSI